MANPDPDKPLLDLGRARVVRGRRFSLRLPLAERVRAARRVPQAVIKVASYATGKRVMGLVNYISRNGKLALETNEGEILKDLEEQKNLVESWTMDFDQRVRSRDAVHIVFSMPHGSPPEALKNAARATLAESFPDHDWVFAVHEDRKHPHAHVVVKTRGREGEKKLRLNKPELYRLRETFAKSAREQGVQLSASPRAARGIGRKATTRALYHLRSKGITPTVERKAAQQALMELRQGSPRKPWEAAMEARHRQEKAAYHSEAQALRKAALTRQGEDRTRLEKAARDLEGFSKNMDTPLTRRQEWQKNAQAKSPLKSKDREKTPATPPPPEIPLR